MTQTDQETKDATNTVPLRSRRRTGIISRFMGNRDGATAIEFSMLVIPFLLLVFAILETTISFAAQQIMSNAGDTIARQVRTGQLRAADLDEKKLKELVCANLRIIVADDCPGLEVDLREFPSFDAASRERIKFTPDDDIDTTDFDVDPGESLSINMFRVFYRWPVMTDLMRSSMSNIKGGNTLLYSTMTWQNEPFND